MESIESTDYRIFGFTGTGELRANLYAPHTGAFFSWVCAGDVYQLADKLELRWEQPLSDAEWDAIQELLDNQFASLCETCGGTGADPGAINTAGEPCPECAGKREPRADASVDAFAALRQSLTAPRKGPATIPALVGYGKPIARSGYAEIGIPDSKYSEPPLPVFPEVDEPAPARQQGEHSVSTRVSTVVAGTANHQVTTSDSLLARCLCEAVDAVQVAQKYATERGYAVAFGAPEVERIGVSIFIERARDGAVCERKSAGSQYVNGTAKASEMRQ